MKISKSKLQQIIREAISEKQIDKWMAAAKTADAAAGYSPELEQKTGQIMVDYAENAPGGYYEIWNLDTDESILIQTDWDYPGVARTFGWGGEDDDIAGAAEYLDSIIGTDEAVTEDPGYFDME